MTRSCPVRAHDRTIPDRRHPEFYPMTAKLQAFVKAKRDAAVLDHMTAMLNHCVEVDVAQFGKEH